MELNSKDLSKKSSKSTFSIIMYVVAAFVLAIGIASLINSILLFKNTVAQYVTQGYPVDVVNAQLVPNQLLPGIFQSVLYDGIAFILFGIGVLYNKISKALMFFSNCDVQSEAVNENIIEQNTADEEKTEVQEETEEAEKTEEVKVD